MAKGGKRNGAGRKPKPKIEQFAGKGVASTVLDMDGPPADHIRSCTCNVCAGEEKKKCECKILTGDKGEGKITIQCRYCLTREDHHICRCEVCGWWALLTASDRRLTFETRRYLTDRRDGKPAQGVFVGDTRENARELDFGDLPELVAAGKSHPAGKPN